MRRLTLICTVILIFTATAGCIKKDLEIKEYIASWKQNLDIEILRSESSDNFCIIVDSPKRPVIIPDKYYIETTAYTGRRYKVRENDYNYKLERVVRYQIGIYDFNTLELIKVIDMREMLEPYLEEWQFGGTDYQLKEYNGKYYLTQVLTKKKTHKEIVEDSGFEHRRMWIDIEAETANWNEDADNMLNDYILKDISYISIPTSNLSQGNAGLYSIFPKLRDVSHERGIHANVFLYPKKDNEEIISLILDKDEYLNFMATDFDEDDDSSNYGFYKSDGEWHKISQNVHEKILSDYEEYFNTGVTDSGSFEELIYFEDNGSISVMPKIIEN